MTDAATLELVKRALAEDIGAGDVTSLATVPAQARARATITQKQPGVIYGLELAQATFRELDPDCRGRARRRGGPVARGWAGARRRGAHARRCSAPSEPR